MQVKIFTIPLSNTELSEAEVNAFLRGHRILQIDRHFSSEGGGSNRVKRGGSWNNNATNCRVANRNSNTPTDTNNNLGFRLAL